MKIAFSQIYAEPGASFDLPGPLLKAVRERLDGLGKSIKQLSTKLSKEEFELVFIISTSSKIDSLNIKGPNVRRRTGEVEFSLFIPWLKTTTFEEKVEYVLPKIEEGITRVFERYNTDTFGVKDAVHTVLNQVRDNPENFQYRKS
jgi:hypothetical protein